MSRCRLSIEFSRPEPVWRTGESVSGRVVVMTEAAVHCRALVFAARWMVTGRCPTVQENYFHRHLFEGNWPAGGEPAFAFSFRPPPSPLSWAGPLVQVEHRVSVRADIPWREPAICERVFELVPGSEADSIACSSAGRHGRGAIRAPIRNSLSGLRAAWRCPAIISPGVPFVAEGSIESRNRHGVSYASIVLTGAEQTVEWNPRRRKLRQVLFHREFPVEISPPADSGRRRDFCAELVAPEIPAWTLELPCSRVEWTVALGLRRAGRPGWRETRAVRMVPEKGAVVVTGGPPRE